MIAIDWTDGRMLARRRRHTGRLPRFTFHQLIRQAKKDSMQRAEIRPALFSADAWNVSALSHWRAW